MSVQKTMKKDDKLRVILDTNIIVSAVLIDKSNPNKILTAWQNKLFTLLISEKLLKEIQEILKREKIVQEYDLSQEEIGKLIINLEKIAELIISLKEEKLPIHCRDPKDDMILSLAIFGNADYLVTGDKDLLDLKNEKEIGKLKIVTPKEFLACL